MPQKKTSPLRIIIPLIVLLAGIGVAILAANRGGPAKPPTPTGTSPTPDAVADAPAPETGGEEPPAAGEPDAAGGEVAEVEAGPVAALGGLRARTYERQPDLPVLGSLDADSDYEIGVELSPFGLGIESLRLTDYYETIASKEHILVQATQPIQIAGTVSTAVPFALTAVFVNGERVDLTSGPRGEPVWRNREGGAAGSFEAVIEDESGTPVVRIERTVGVKARSHEVQIRQRATNLTGVPIELSWVHSGPLSLDPDSGGYGGDKRRLRFGYWLNAKSQAGDTAVLSDRYTTPFVSLLGMSKEGAGYAFPTSRDIWPNKKSDEAGDRLVWIGLTDRYFGVAMHALVDPAGPQRLMGVSRITRIAGLKPGSAASGKRADLANDAMVLMLADSTTARIAAGGTSSFDLGLFAGPLSIPVINAEPLPKAVGLSGLVLYNFGGICAFCTFQPLAHLLLAVLHFIHDYLTLDWALAIIILVVIVRSCLHPVTRWSQIKMQRFGAQMQAIAPKQAKLKEKYKDDPKRLQQEMTKLWREEGINPAGMLGCLPMMLQSPVWIALYATLFFAVELRHEPGFYGVFQQMGGWQFLADLSRSDNAIPLGKGFTLFGLAHIDAINILPIIMGFVFYFHQKYLTPPTATTMTPEQESQQKFIKIAMIFLFPIMMYAAPSGLALYFVTNSTLAIFENKWIRAHMNKHGLLDADKIRERVQAKREARKEGGFIARLQKAAAEQQKREQASKRMMRRVKNTAPERSEPNFKKKKPKK